MPDGSTSGTVIERCARRFEASTIKKVRSVPSIARIFTALSLLAIAAFAQPPTILIQDTIYLQNGQKYNGLVQIYLSTPVISNGSVVLSLVTQQQLTFGALKVNLVPNGATGTSYLFRFVTGGATETCTFPVISGPVTLSGYCSTGGSLYLSTLTNQQLSSASNAQILSMVN